MKRDKEQVCDECGGEFLSFTVEAECCSDKCRMRKYRRGAKGKANVLKYNAKVKRPDIKKVCGICGVSFVSGRGNRIFCSKCSGSKTASNMITKRHRDRFPYLLPRSHQYRD